MPEITARRARIMPTLLCNSAYYSGTLRDIQQNCCILKWCWLQLVFEVVFMSKFLRWRNYPTSPYLTAREYGSNIRQKIWTKRSKLDDPEYVYTPTIKWLAYTYAEKIISRHSI